jgi:predicted glutamine amidotransferase
VERQAWAAYHGEHFQRAAARVYAETVIAHVRRATVGEISLANTRPFVAGRWVLIHNGTVPHFDRLAPVLRQAMTVEQRAAISGTTDSEHIFRLALSTLQRNASRPLLDVLRDTLAQVIGWSRAVDPDADLGLNVLLSDGHELVGPRWGRGLVMLDRRGVRDCEICGFAHIHHDPRRDYHAVIVASEPLSHEDWHELPDHSVFRIGPDLAFHHEPLQAGGGALIPTRGAHP